MDLEAIWLTTLERCAPERLVKRHVDATMPRNVVAIGKCAGALLDGIAEMHPIESAFVAIPDIGCRARTRRFTRVGIRT